MDARGPFAATALTRMCATCGARRRATDSWGRGTQASLGIASMKEATRRLMLPFRSLPPFAFLLNSSNSDPASCSTAPPDPQEAVCATSSNMAGQRQASRLVGTRPSQSLRGTHAAATSMLHQGAPREAHHKRCALAHHASGETSACLTDNVCRGVQPDMPHNRTTHGRPLTDAPDHHSASPTSPLPWRPRISRCTPGAPWS